MLEKIYGKAHCMAKRILGKNVLDNHEMSFISLTEECFENGRLKKSLIECVDQINYMDTRTKNSKTDFYPVENVVSNRNKDFFPLSFDKKTNFSPQNCNNLKEAKCLWEKFIKEAQIPYGYKNEGLYYAGYIGEFHNWCLPSWIWTNAALVRYYCSIDNRYKATEIAEILLKKQEKCGGWIVRNDYERGVIVPELAPNDSAYIANNACLCMFRKYAEERYLKAAEKCAEWIMNTSREDGFVYLAYDMVKNKWIKDKNIVDTGFTAALFANLYDITKKEIYANYLRKFIYKYCDLFYSIEKQCFWTSIDAQDSPFGGKFARGQAWALEGLIPSYLVLRDEKLKKIIQNTINYLVENQNKNGGWAYNFEKPLMGQDCKGIPVIAASLLTWYRNVNQDDNILNSVYNAIDWCVKHTNKENLGRGGIFCYSLEGAIVHHLYTSTSFTYSCAYALETLSSLEEINENGR